jgi:hypothetical protein
VGIEISSRCDNLLRSDGDWLLFDESAKEATISVKVITIEIIGTFMLNNDLTGTFIEPTSN